MLQHKIKYGLWFKGFFPFFITICLINLTFPVLAQPMKDLRVGNKYVYDLYEAYQNSSLITQRENFVEVRRTLYVEECIGDSLLNGQRYTIVVSSFDKSHRFERSNDTAIFEYRNGKEFITHKWNVKPLDTVNLDGIPTLKSRLYNPNGQFLINSVQTGVFQNAVMNTFGMNYSASSLFLPDSLAVSNESYYQKPLGFQRISLYRGSFRRTVNVFIPVASTLFNTGRVINGVVAGDTSLQDFTIQVPIKAEVLSTSASVGQKVEVIIRLVGVRRFAELASQYGCSTGSITFSHNASLLEPIGYVPINSVEKGLRKMKLPFEFDGKSDTAFYKLSFRAVVGNAVSTELMLDTLQVSGKSVSAYQVTEIGTYTCLGLNIAGGAPSLFYSTGKTLLSVSPMPTNELAIISYSLLQKTSVKLVIYDMTGKIMATINEGVRETGEYTTLLNSSMFPNGTYLLQLITDAGVVAQNSIIVFH